MPQQMDHVWPKGFEGGLAHRLDNATSGSMLVAQDPQALEQLRLGFTHKSFRKVYWFLTAKEPRWKEHSCHAPLAHHKKKKGSMIPQRGKQTPHRGKWYSASTSFRHLCRKEGVSLYEATMHSGVMHQIRCHAGFLGVALLGDRRYGGGQAPNFFVGDFALHHIQFDDWPAISPPSWWPTWVLELYKERA